MSLNVKPDDRRMSAPKNASVFGLGFSFRGRGPTVIYCVFLFNSDSPKFRGTKAATQKLWVLRVPTQKTPLKPVMGRQVWALLGNARVFGFEIPTLPPTIPVTQTLCIDVKDWATRFPFILLLSHINIGALNST